jgi:helix-turn-helix protein
MNNENLVHIHNVVLFSHKGEQNYIIYRKIDENRDDHGKQSKPVWEMKVLNVFFHIWNIVIKNEWQKCKTGSVWGEYDWERGWIKEMLK